MSTTTTKKPAASETEATKRSKKLESELKSLKREVESIDSNTKTTAKDVASVTKSLRNAKQIAKAAKSANAKVTDADMNRLNQSLEREKQLSKIVDKMSGTFTKRDVNAIERSLQYGKELAKLSRSLSGKIGAAEIRTLNKTLSDAREVKRITKSLTGKSAAGMAKPLKKVTSNTAGGDDGISETLTGILESVSAIPKMADDISKLTKALINKENKEKSAKVKALEDKYEARNRPKERVVANKVYDSSGSSGINLMEIALTALGTAGFAASVYKSLAPELKQAIKDAIKEGFAELFTYGWGKVKKETTEIKDAGKDFINDPNLKTAEKLGKETKDLANPYTSTGAKVIEYGGKKGLQYTNKALGYVPFYKKIAERALKAGAPVAPYIARIPGLSGWLGLASATSDALMGASKKDELGADSETTAAIGSFFGGQQDDPMLLRMTDKALAFGAIGTMIQPGFGTFLGAGLGAMSGAVGPRGMAAGADVTKRDFQDSMLWLKLAGSVVKGSAGAAVDYVEENRLENQIARISREVATAQRKLDKLNRLEASGSSTPNIPENKLLWENKRKAKQAELDEAQRQLNDLRNSDAARYGHIKVAIADTYYNNQEQFDSNIAYKNRRWAEGRGEKPSEPKGMEPNPNMSLVVPNQPLTENFVTPEILAALGLTESNMNPYAVSPKNAKGLLQLMPPTAEYLGVKDPFDPKQNLTGGMRYLNQMIKQFGSLEAGLAAYNVGPGAFEKLSARAGSTDVRVIKDVLGIGPSLKGIGQLPQETYDYVTSRFPNYYNKIKSGQLLENVDYVQNTLGKEAFEGSSSAQPVIITGSFNTTTVVQDSAPQARLPEIPEQITLEYGPQH